MDEWQIRRGSSMNRVARDMLHLMTALATIDESLLTD
jgi:N-dimethylarginine dimethylaminohydrolase